MENPTTQIQKNIEKFLNQEVIIRGGNYKGKGRPCKSDYIQFKRKELGDYWITQMLKNGVKINYIKL